MNAVNIAVLLGLLFIALAITIIKLELVFKSVLHAYKEKKYEEYEEKYKEEKRILKFQQGEERSQCVKSDLLFH
ncbi:MAG: hypothetical protein QXQ02_01330 [Halobacteria archaeon]